MSVVSLGVWRHQQIFTTPSGALPSPRVWATKFDLDISIYKKKFLTSTLGHFLSNYSNKEEKSKLWVEVSKVVIEESEDMFHDKYKNGEC